MHFLCTFYDFSMKYDFSMGFQFFSKVPTSIPPPKCRIGLPSVKDFTRSVARKLSDLQFVFRRELLAKIKAAQLRRKSTKNGGAIGDIKRGREEKTDKRARWVKKVGGLGRKEGGNEKALVAFTPETSPKRNGIVVLGYREGSCRVFCSGNDTLFWRGAIWNCQCPAITQDAKSNNVKLGVL